ncbi:MAG: type I methionyl aminopeptidase [Planctomycetota bacterium]
MPAIPKVTGADADAAYTAAQKVVDVHKRLVDFLAHGQTLAQIDTFVARTLDELGCKSCFLGYRAGGLPPFPSHACLSVNECVVHGTAAYLERPMEHGDVLKIDIGVSHRGWIGDAAYTYVFGEKTPDVDRLCKAGKKSLMTGIEQLAPGNTYMQWARTVEDCVEREFGLKLIRGLGGHGYGRKLHAPPFVSNTVPKFPGEWPDGKRQCEPGTLIAVEPMIAVTTGDTFQRPKTWPIFVADNSMSVHYEHDVLITENGPKILTEGLDELPDLITR